LESKNGLLNTFRGTQIKRPKTDIGQDRGEKKKREKS